jgi:hypothetical protein
MIQVVNLDQSDKWDSIVRTFHKYDTYYLSGYVRAFQLHGDGEPLLLYYDGKNDIIRGINVVMKRDASTAALLRNKVEAGRYYDLTTPYGYGGWLVERNDGAKTTAGNVHDSYLFKDYSSWCLQNNIVAEFVRFHPMIENHIDSNGEYTIIPLGETVAMDLSSPESVWDNMSSKNRNAIRKAIKNGVRVYNGRSPELYETFRDIYNTTMDKDEAAPYYYFEDKFYRSLCDDLPENAQIFYALYDNKIVAASIFLISNGFMNYHLSGSVRGYSSLAATNLIIYRAALFGSVVGCKTLYLGGGVGSGEDGLLKFKRSFYKGQLHRFYIGKKVMSATTYDGLCRASGVESHSMNVEVSGYFPEYRG